MSAVLGKLTTPQVLQALERHHPDDQGEWVFLREALGIDALAISCWAGRRRPAFPRVGYEVKVSRSDWLRELKQPGKREFAMSICDRFFFAAPWGLIKLDEVPEGCGLVQILPETPERRMRVHTTLGAPLLEPRGLKRKELSSLLRYRMNPNHVRALKTRARYFEDRSNTLMETLADRVGERDAAFGRLEEKLGETVVEGSVWLGPWPPHRKLFLEGQPRLEDGLPVRVFVMEIRRYSGGQSHVSIRREDNPHPSYFEREQIPVGELLARYDPVAT